MTDAYLCYNTITMRKPWIIFFISFFLFCAVLLLYTATLPNMNTGYADSDELITVAKIGGVAHPPGYPLYTMLTMAIGALPIPLTFAGKANLLSSIFHSLAVVLTFLTAYLLSRRFVENELLRVSLALSGAITLAITFSFWFYGLFAEVFSLNNFFISLFTFLVVWWDDKRNEMIAPSRHSGTETEGRVRLLDRRGKQVKRAHPESVPKRFWIFDQNDKRILLLAAFIFGLALSNQQIVVLLILPIAFWVLSRSWRILLDLRFMAIAIGLLVSGFLLPYIYHPIAASNEAVINWENPQTLTGIYRSITRRTYAEWSASGEAYAGGLSAYKLEERIKGVIGYFDYLIDNMTLPLFVLGVFGIGYLLWRKAYRILITLLLGVGAGGMIVAFYGPHTVPEYYNYYFVGLGIYQRFFLASLLFTSLLTFFGMVGIIDIAKRFHKRAVYGILFVVALMIGVIGYLHFTEIKQTNFSLAKKYGEVLLNSLPKDAIVFCFSEHNCFTAVYMQQVEGLRKDVMIIHGPFYQWPIEQIRKAVPGLVKTTTDRTTVQHSVLLLRDIVRWNIDKRPIFVAGIKGDQTTLSAYGVFGDPFYLVPHGCEFQVARSYSPAKDRPNCPGFDKLVNEAKRSYFTKKAPISYMFPSYFSNQHYMNASLYSLYLCYGKAKQELAKSGGISSHFTEPKKIIAEAEKRKLNDEKCGLTTKPLDKKTLIKQADEAFQKGMIDHALYYILQVVSIDPKDIDARLTLASYYMAADSVNNARIEYQDILTIDPGNAFAKKELERIQAVLEL